MNYYTKVFWGIVITIFFGIGQSNAQVSNTQIKGFVDVITSYQKNKSAFTLGEQDLFITSDLSDRLSFLGESVLLSFIGGFFGLNTVCGNKQ